MELLTGLGRRRQWSAEEKSRIVAETLAPGAAVSDVARRWQVCPQQVFGWPQARIDELMPWHWTTAKEGWPSKPG